jgi:hypothetical protein
MISLLLLDLITADIIVISLTIICYYLIKFFLLAKKDHAFYIRFAFPMVISIISFLLFILFFMWTYRFFKWKRAREIGNFFTFISGASLLISSLICYKRLEEWMK